ncbi:methyltransferase domain-containing protein [Streptomyces griseocarneus]|uniref:methyltransferase domain-containing protein n=1 Tax=Streptomyces griseocarneus TaxID=51201 RepID=UPI00167E0AB5|nr:methyltransferase domain-containing protein [Streptomyces griseocarneus]MBZ6472548.1 protein-L-isoaspartate(D-aspartate) O-methyltransferase [Streptomyces griseocarneus]GHG45856.1 protein-L-isoaspartate O-methyltransferase [Streptomyces griseocarneus]
MGFARNQPDYEVKAGALTSDWLGSFQAVPRELFVPDRIWPGIADGTRQTGLVDRAKDPEAWFEAVYSDIPLTTQWDDGRHSGNGLGTMPTSSSSMPRMVFSMLADLDVADGHRVLEIGTGTGWNAGLLAHRLGGANVVSVEYDADVSMAAVENLRRAGLAPLALVGDGRLGHPASAPFDRVIATCSVGEVPRAWVEQARPGGLIVAPWGTEYGGEYIARLVVGNDGTANGPFTRSSAFMRLRQQRTERPPFEAYLKGQEWPSDGTRSTTTLSPADIGGWLAQFVIGLHVPGAFWRVERYGDGTYTLWTYSTDTRSWASAGYEPEATEYTVVQSGPRRLWDETEAACLWWEENSRPGFDRFGLTVDGEGERVWLGSPDQPIPCLST